MTRFAHRPSSAPGRGRGRLSLPALACACALALSCALSPADAAQIPQKDQDRIAPSGPPLPAPSPPLLRETPETLAPPEEGEEAPCPVEEEEAAPGGAFDAIGVGELPDLRAVELTPQSARRALDAFAAIYGKYDDAEIAKYSTLQEFADKTEAGAKMQEQIRSFGFANVAEWNLVIMNIGFAYSSIVEGSDEAIRQQIAQTQKDASLPEKKRERMLKSLRALIPSPNNRRIVEELLDIPAYAKKLRLLDEE